jgi:hypothetical protein
MEATPEDAKGMLSGGDPRSRAITSCAVRPWKFGCVTRIIGPVPTTAIWVKSAIGS